MFIIINPPSLPPPSKNGIGEGSQELIPTPTAAILKGVTNLLSIRRMGRVRVG
jgi:hypothetical protein